MMTKERFAELMAMPKFLRVKEMQRTGETSDFQACVRQQASAKEARKQERKDKDMRSVIYKPRYGSSYEGYRPHRNGPTMYGQTQIWED